MAPLLRLGRARRLTLALWGAGLAALVGTLVYGHFHSTPYFVTWAWLSFMGMVVCEDEVTSVDRPDWRPLPRVTLLAAIIVFRKHPEVTVLVALAGGAAASLLRRQPWLEQLSTWATWILLAAGGSAAFGLVGFADSPHFVAATLVVIALFTAVDCWGRFARRSAVTSVALGTIGALIALAFRTPGWADAIVLRMAQLALLAASGFVIGALLGSPKPALLRAASPRRMPPALMASFVLLLVSVALPNQASWIAAALGLVIALTWVVSRWAFAPAVILLGGLCNEIARGANGGRMPVDVSHLSAAMRTDFAAVAQHSTSYVLANAHSGLLFLADRFPAGPFPGVASLGDLTIAAGIVWWCAGTPGIPRRSRSVSEQQPAVAA